MEAIEESFCRCASSILSSTKGVKNGNGGRLSTSGSADVELSFSVAVATVVRAQPKEGLLRKNRLLFWDNFAIYAGNYARMELYGKEKEVLDLKLERKRKKHSTLAGQHMIYVTSMIFTYS
ncbi:hypothetical protein Tco_1122727 [Tanacetum coccineum]|uniref:Uncharacterized protein n=1 Tax=Tanacetum coccineum TaxID=301880 RepID=A0ABQ5J1C8_9ASTR